jgi:hypothetical protein
MSKRLAAMSVAIAAFIALCWVPYASAVSPVSEPVELPAELLLPAGAFCSWEALVTFPVNKEIATTFYDANGNIDRVMITGSLRATVTNVENGKSITLNIPGTQVIVDDLVTYRGPNVIFPVDGSLKLVSGRVVVTVDSEGFQHPVTVSGLRIDICTLLG